MFASKSRAPNATRLDALGYIEFAELELTRHFWESALCHARIARAVAMHREDDTIARSAEDIAAAAVERCVPKGAVAHNRRKPKFPDARRVLARATHALNHRKFGDAAMHAEIAAAIGTFELDEYVLARSQAILACASEHEARGSYLSRKKRRMDETTTTTGTTTGTSTPKEIESDDN
ncbi:hypothetical protein CTAYLR_004584 [Chrysophaeum taylorii]|uniref:Uncharacterized protein n=1 Tax=Chrysophaeum taylorii TaxID=2483200 RepID=A0AAD7XIP9_9STRA|nr:hypothetical protein CTAYLR_004584 [Chrysophaeum taylorii]